MNHHIVRYGQVLVNLSLLTHVSAHEEGGCIFHMVGSTIITHDVTVDQAEEFIAGHCKSLEEAP